MPGQKPGQKPAPDQEFFSVEIEPEAWEEINALPWQAQEQIFDAIEALELNPRPGNAKYMKRDWRGYWRVRAGNYRVIYRIEDAVLIVVVVKVGDRRDIYE